MDDEKAKGFHFLLLKCIEDTVSSLLGENTMKAFGELLQKDTGLKLDELVIQIDVLKASLKGIFGRSAFVLEAMIARQIYGELGLANPPRDLKVAIEHAKQAYMATAPNLLVSR